MNEKQITRERRSLELARERLAYREATLRAVVVTACDGGMSELEAARLAGVSRSTIRRWRGKHTWRDQHGKA